MDGFLHETINTMLKSLVENLKKQIAIVIAEVTSKALLEHVFYENEYKRSGGQKYLKANDRITSIVKMTTQYINRTPFSSHDDSQISGDSVQSNVMERLKDSLNGNNDKARTSLTQS